MAIDGMKVIDLDSHLVGDLESWSQTVEAKYKEFLPRKLPTKDNDRRKTLVGKPAILENVTPSPSGDYILVSRLKRQFSRLVPMNGFPKEIEIWNRRGELVKKLADVPSSEFIPIGGVETGPRNCRDRKSVV